jgi:cytochrome c-type protein NapC
MSHTNFDPFDMISPTLIKYERCGKNMQKFKQLNRFQKFLVLLVIAFMAGFVLPFLSWWVGEESFTATSNATFCVSCHSMEPFVKSNADTAHGGNNEYGIKASCTDCHLPHNNSANYLYVKGLTGIRDILAETFKDTSKIDWAEVSEHRADFVYNSGCESCHAELEMATDDSRVHDRYFGDITDTQCVECHSEVGHSNLNEYLLELKYQP